MSIRQKTALALLLAAIVAVAIYHAGLRGAFFFDDIPNLLATDSIRMSELSWESIRYASTGGYSSPWGRPVAQLSFALNHYFHGLSPYAFKLTNLLIHLVCAGLVFTLALRPPLRHTSPQHCSPPSGCSTPSRRFPFFMSFSA